MQMVSGRMVLITVVFIFSLMVTCSCSRLERIDGKTSKGDKSSLKKGDAPRYHEFDDILVPGGLKVHRDLTFVFQISSLTAGVLALQGGQEAGPLIDFFETNMLKDNWRAVNSFRSPRSMLLFEKGNRWCTITISEKGYHYKTLVEIWVSPKAEGVTAPGLVQ